MENSIRQLKQIWYANVNNRLTTVEAQQIKQETVNDKITSIESQIAVINTNLEFIKDKVK